MKICQIVSSFPPISWGGTETHNYTLVKYLIEKGYDTSVIVTGQETNKRKASYDGIRINYFKPKPLLWYKQLKDLVKKTGEFDVLDVHRNHVVLPFVRCKTPIILSLHFFELTCPIPIKSNIDGKGWPRPCEEGWTSCLGCIGSRRYMRWWISKNIAIKRADSIMVKYEALRNLMIGNGVPENKINVVPHWLDIEKINKRSKKSKSKNRRIRNVNRRILFLGRMDHEKGPDILLGAFPSILEKHPQTELVFVGDGPMMKNLKSNARGFGKNISEKVVFVGHVKHQDVPEYFGMSDVVVFPHRFFNYEWGLLEAMCCEKPIVATDMFATRDILNHEKNALLCSLDEVDISSSVSRILDDQKLSRRISSEALKTIKQKHSMKNLRIYEKLLNELAGKKSK